MRKFPQTALAEIKRTLPNKELQPLEQLMGRLDSLLLHQKYPDAKYDKIIEVASNIEKLLFAFDDASRQVDKVRVLIQSNYNLLQSII